MKKKEKAMEKSFIVIVFFSITITALLSGTSHHPFGIKMCVELCESHGECCSVAFNAETLTCIKGDKPGMPTSYEVHWRNDKCQREQYVIGSECTGDDECGVNNSVCFRGTCLCTPGYSNIKTEDKCNRMTWTPHTCSDVLKKYPNAEDGEYILFPQAPQFLGQPVKIYCKMTGRTPKEYVTLVNKNYGVFPNYTATKSCRGKKPLNGNVRKRAGETYFAKLRVRPQTMSVIISDEAFISKTQHELPLNERGYGKALDCYNIVCDPKGTFFINTLGTGMKFSQQLTWKGVGYKPRVASVERKEGGAVINLRCGGFCGGCTPDGDMFLYPNAMDRSN